MGQRRASGLSGEFYAVENYQGPRRCTWVDHGVDAEIIMVYRDPPRNDFPMCLACTKSYLINLQKMADRGNYEYEIRVVNRIINDMSRGENLQLSPGDIRKMLT